MTTDTSQTYSGRTWIPGAPTDEIPLKPEPGWRGVWPDVVVRDSDPLATAIAKLKEQLSSSAEPSAR